MKVRPYCDRDIAQIVSLLNDANRNSYEFIPDTEATVRARLTGASPVLVATDRQDRALGLTYLRQDWYGETVTLYAQPGPSKDEIYNLLLVTVEPQNKTGEVSTSVDTLDEDRLTFFAARGYEPEGSLCQMLADLEQPLPMPSLPDGYVTRSLRAEEEEMLIRLANTAYDGERLQPGILARWSDDPVFDIDLIHVAEYKGEMVALVAGRSDRDYNQYYHARRGYLGPAATLPSHRGKGLGKVLTARAMQSLRQRGMQTVCLHTWNRNRPALTLVRDLGFHLDHEWQIMRRDLALSTQKKPKT